MRPCHSSSPHRYEHAEEVVPRTPRARPIRAGICALLLGLGLGCASSPPPAAEATSGAEAPSATAATQAASAPTAGMPPAPAAPAPAEPPAPAPANAAETPAADVQPKPDLRMPPYAAIVVQRVKDFDAWMRVFEGDAEARKAASIVGQGVMRGVDDPKMVATYLPFTDLAQVKTFLGDKRHKMKHKEAGVRGKPTVYLFKLVSAKMAMHPQGDVFGAITKYRVKDFDGFKTAVEGEDAARNTAGIIGWGIGQDADTPNEAYLYLQSDAASKLKAYLGSPQNKTAMNAAGAKGEPKTTFIQEISNRMYE